MAKDKTKAELQADLDNSVVLLKQAIGELADAKETVMKMDSLARQQMAEIETLKNRATFSVRPAWNAARRTVRRLAPIAKQAAFVLLLVAAFNLGFRLPLFPKPEPSPLPIVTPISDDEIHCTAKESELVESALKIIETDVDNGDISSDEFIENLDVLLRGVSQPVQTKIDDVVKKNCRT